MLLSKIAGKFFSSVLPSDQEIAVYFRYCLMKFASISFIDFPLHFRASKPKMVKSISGRCYQLLSITPTIDVTLPTLSFVKISSGS